MPKTHTITIGPKSYELAKLTRGDRAEIADQLVAKRREQIAANLAGAGDKERAESLDAFDYSPNAFGLFGRYAASDKGGFEILSRCAEKVHNGQGKAIAEEIDSELDDDAFTELIGALCHIKWTKAEAKPSEPAPPNPTAPDSSNTPNG